jgi:hypothetical protein
VIANTGKVIKSGGRENKLMLAMAALGFVPLAGDGAKAILKQALAKGVGENIDEAAEVVLKAVSETAPQFKDGEEALAALRAGGAELAGVKATLKGSMVVLEMTGQEAKALANDSGRIKSLVAIAESKGIGRLSLKIAGPEAKEAIQNIKLFNSLSAEGLEPIRVASEKAKLSAKANYEEAKGVWTTAKGESRRLINEAETAVKASDEELALAKAKKAEFEELVTRWKSKEVSDSEFIRKAEGYIEGARPAGDRAGSQGELLGSDRVQQGGGSHLEGSGRNPPQGSGSVGQSHSAPGREPSGTGQNVQRAERIRGDRWRHMEVLRAEGSHEITGGTEPGFSNRRLRTLTKSDPAFNTKAQRFEEAIRMQARRDAEQADSLVVRYKALQKKMDSLDKTSLTYEEEKRTLLAEQTKLDAELDELERRTNFGTGS